MRKLPRLSTFFRQRSPPPSFLYDVAIHYSGSQTLNFTIKRKSVKMPNQAKAVTYNGKPGKLLDPKGSATRAEAATVLYRYCDRYGEESN